MMDSSAYLMQESFTRSGECSARQALGLYRWAEVKGRLGQWWAKATGRSRRMLDLAEIEATVRIAGRHYEGVRTVELSRIRGSDGRAGDFDAAFHPLAGHNRDRWLSVASARLHGMALPAVELVQIGENYFVLDGHHRVSVAAALGETCIEAEVTVWQIREAPCRSIALEESAAYAACPRSEIKVAAC